jgi:hypothetical protein
MKKYLIGLLLAVFFCASAIAEDTKTLNEKLNSFNDNIMYSVTLEQGMESQLKYGYFYATKPWTEKFSTTYSASVAIDSVNTEHMLDMYSQTLNLSYSIGNGLSFYMLSDINPHFQRTETWIGTTYSW